MGQNRTNLNPPKGQRKATFSRVGSKETKRALVRSAVALWRTNGFADTTVADICAAAGVSKGLFYFYFARKEDILNEVGVLSIESTRAEARKRMVGDYELFEVIDAVLAHFGRSMRRNPRPLVLEVILEGYRRESLLGPDADPAGLLFTDLFERAVADGRLPDRIEPRQLSRRAQTIVSESARAWASGALGTMTFEQATGSWMRVLVDGTIAQLPSQRPGSNRRLAAAMRRQ